MECRQQSGRCHLPLKTGGFSADRNAMGCTFREVSLPALPGMGGAMRLRGVFLWVAIMLASQAACRPEAFDDDLELLADPADLIEEDEALSLDGAAATTALKEETGVIDLQLWNEDVGALRGWTPLKGEYYYWTGDNALMLWALTEPRYAHLRSLGWGTKIRDYLIQASYGKGLFTEGTREKVAGGARSNSPHDCSPRMESQVLWGIIAYTAAFRTEAGAKQPADYDKFIEDALETQHKKFMAGAKGSRSPKCTGYNHDFEEAAAIAFHILNGITWSRVTGNAKYRKLAAEAWTRLAGLQDDELGYFGKKDVLRNAQVLFCLTKAIASKGKFPGIVAARNKLVKALRFKKKSGAVGFAGMGFTTDTQVSAYSMLVFKKRPPSTKAFFANRICGTGYTWRGIRKDPDEGPVEDLAMGLLGAAHADRRGWSQAGAPCSL